MIGPHTLSMTDNSGMMHFHGSDMPKTDQIIENII